MTVQALDIAQPFFGVTFITDETTYKLSGRAIVLNLGEKPLGVEGQDLPPLQSSILTDTRLVNIGKAVVVRGFDDFENEYSFLARIRREWPSAYEVRREERLRGIEHYMSPKQWIGQIGLTFYHSASVPLKVGLHKDHPFCPVPGFREVHTQIVGLGKMQQCRERDISTLYLEEIMAPGMTHRPMFDEQGAYPWHQFETITPGVFMAVEMLPEGAQPPA